LVLVLLAVLVIRALPGSQTVDRAARLTLEPDVDRAVDALARYVRIDTSTPPGIPEDREPGYIPLLVDTYAKPLGLEWEVIDTRSLLLRWKAGRAGDGGPLLLLSHADVVPVAPDERPRWAHPPFSGAVAGGFIWGRGTIDNKGSTICQLEAIAALQRAGLRPHRDVYLLVVPDEEIGGERGAKAILEDHRDALDEPWAVLDEGSFVIPDFLPGSVLAPIAVSEKRYVTVRAVVEGEAGHASMPQRDAPPRLLSLALGRLAELRHPRRRLEPVERLLDAMARESGFGGRLVLSNRWLFGRLVNDQLAGKPASNAMIRDTMALTVLRAGIKDNVVPARAEATLNLRLLPTSDLDQVLARMREAIGDERVRLEVVEDAGASPIAPMKGPRWTRLEAAVGAALPEVTVAPFLSPGTMDARHFAQAGIPAYRFLPFTLEAGERERMHGIDERLSIANVEQAIRVYAHVMRHY
jgi:carboxypeptidase PM20D1